MNNLTIEQYLERPEIGSSTLKNVLRNAKKANLVKTGQLNITTKNMNEGRIFHTILLEPEKLESYIYIGRPLSDELADIYKHMNTFERIHVVDVGNKNQKEFQNKKKELTENERLVTKAEMDLLERHMANKDKIFILQDRLEEIKKWADKIRALPHMTEILENGESEKTFFGEILGLPVKIRVDKMYKLPDDRYLILDLKSMEAEATPDEFRRASERELYFFQESLYWYVLLQNAIPVKEFKFAAASKEIWSGAGYFAHNERSRAIGDRMVESAVEKYKYCQDKNLWLESEYNYQNNNFETVSNIEISTYVTKQFFSMDNF